MQRFEHLEPSSVARGVLIDALTPAAVAIAIWKFSPGVAPKERSARASTLLFNGGDNRLWIGPLFVLIICIQVIVHAFTFWCQLSPDYLGLLSGLASATVLLQWFIAAIVGSRELLAYIRSIRHRHYGLFNNAFLAFLTANLCANMIQTYYTFFTPANWSTPAWGAGVSSDSASSYSASLPLKRRFTYTQLPQLPSSELGDSILENIMFSWVGKLVAIGQQRQPKLSDLPEPPQQYLLSSSWSRFKANAHHRNNLVRHLAFTFRPEIIMQVILNPLCVALDYAQPFLMQLFLRFITTYTKDPSGGLRYGYFLATCMLLTSLAANMVQQQQDWCTRTLFMHIRNVLLTMLARKTMRRKAKNSNDASGSDDKNTSDGRMYSVITADILRMSKLIKLIRAVMMVPFQLLLGAFYMERLLGMAGILGTLMLVAVVYLTRKLIDRSKRIESQLSKVNDRRLAVISEVIQGIISVKLMGWKSRFIDMIGERRAEQLSVMWRRAKLSSLINLCTIGSLPFVVFATFAVYSLNNRLDAETIFTAIAVFKLIQNTVDMLPSLVSYSTTFYVSFRRIESYLGQDDVQPLEERIDANNDTSALGFNNAIFLWNVDSQFRLGNLDVRFPSGKLSLIGGPTGSGKSSLLSALIGNMELIQGKVLVPTHLETDDMLNINNDSTLLSDIAFVSQEPWLRNATIRENILFGEPFEKQRYERVLRMCALGPDLALLSARDLSEIGERGITLSGGQRQRVALARAIYSSRKILLIDDCLSAVDAHTGRHILHKCLLTNNALMNGRTCVLVTHHMALCLPHADYVVTMQNGQIDFQGTPEEALANPNSQVYGLDCVDSGGIEDLSTAYNSGASSSAEDDDDDSKDSIDSSDNHASQESSRATTMTTSSTTACGKLVQDEERIVGAIRLDTWKIYFKACGGQWFLITCIVYIVTMQFLAMYKDFYIAKKLDYTHPPCTTARCEIRWLVIYLGFGVLSATVASVGLLITSIGSQRASAVLHERLTNSILSAKLRWLETNPIGRTISRFSSDIQEIDDSIMSGMTSMMRPLMSLLISLVVISSTVPSFIIVGVIVLVVYAHYSWLFMQIQRETKRLDSTAYAPVISLFSEMISGSALIRAFALESAFMADVKRHFSAYLSAEFSRRSTSRWMRIRVGVVGSLVSFATALFILANVKSINSGIAGFILLQTVGFLKDTIVVVRKYSDLEIFLAAVERVHQYLEIEHEAPSHKANDNDLPVGWPNTGNLSVYNLVTGYTSDVPILHELSFSVNHGEKIGVVGRTGAGKSSLALALMRLIEASSGQIVLDGVNIATIGLEALRQKVAIIPQDPVMFNGTIRFNLDPFGSYPDELLIDVLRRTLLLRDAGNNTSSVAAFSSLNDVVMGHGQNLSLGQRQLVAMARALMRRSHLVILDEATAAVDFENDSRIQGTIRGPEFADATLFCIAHRLRTIIDYDRILVLDEGKIVEFDTPAALIQQEGGYFRELCENSNEFALLQKLAQSNKAK
ncbi:hypothetical protein LPJ54_003410 [Coemansia sp. RSA 1824]|nr:hypothetical protein LPJ54_003410 [Coemansia sp. RSA 1824]